MDIAYDMPCFSPLRGYRAAVPNSSGRRSIVFSPNDGLTDLPVEVPCGQCIGCRLERSRKWAIRCVHEASLHDQNSFITLTYDNEHLPSDLSLKVIHFQKFMKRLRKRIEPELVRFFHCGEYGEKNGRPHYHALLFGYQFPDLYPWKETNGQILYRSPMLEELWPYGHSLVGHVTFESAAYVARYVVKKITGKEAAAYYGDRKHPYVTMSRRPGIGTEWFKQFKNDVYPHDYLIIRNGIKSTPPRFYDNMLETIDQKTFKKIKNKRRNKACNPENYDDNTPSRLHQKAIVKGANLEQLVRTL